MATRGAGGVRHNINGATGSTYTITDSDIGSPLRVEAFYDGLTARSAMTEDVACYCRGALIWTERGEQVVER